MEQVVSAAQSEVKHDKEQPCTRLVPTSTVTLRAHVQLQKQQSELGSRILRTLGLRNLLELKYGFY